MKGERRVTAESIRESARQVRDIYRAGGSDMMVPCVQCGEEYLGRQHDRDHRMPCPECRAVAREAA